MEALTTSYNAIETAEEIIDGRKCENTKNQYNRKFEHFRQQIVEKYPECTLTDRVTVNLALLNKVHVHDLFEHTCKKKKNGDYGSPIVYQSFQHVSGYKSSIMDHFATSECEIKPDIDKMLKNFFGGYHRKIASLKSLGRSYVSYRGKTAHVLQRIQIFSQRGKFNLSIFSHFLC